MCLVFCYITSICVKMLLHNQPQGTVFTLHDMGLICQTVMKAMCETQSITLLVEVHNEMHADLVPLVFHLTGLDKELTPLPLTD